MIRKTIFFLLLALFSLFSYAEEINKRALESWLSISQKNISSSLIKVIADQVMIEKKKKGILRGKGLSGIPETFKVV